MPFGCIKERDRLPISEEIGHKKKLLIFAVSHGDRRRPIHEKLGAEVRKHFQSRKQCRIIASEKFHDFAGNLDNERKGESSSK